LGKGCVFIFHKNDTDFSQMSSKLVANDAESFNQGYSVALNADGNILASGAPGSSGGAVFIFILNEDGVTWSNRQKLIGSKAFLSR
jgi:hypothetical protein